MSVTWGNMTECKPDKRRHTRSRIRAWRDLDRAEYYFCDAFDCDVCRVERQDQALRRSFKHRFLVWARATAAKLAALGRWLP